MFVGLLRLRLLGSDGCRWLKTFVNCKVNDAPTRSVNLRSLANVASAFQRVKPLRLPVPPQLLSSPRMHLRNRAKIAAGSPYRLLPSTLLVPMPPEPVTFR